MIDCERIYFTTIGIIVAVLFPLWLTGCETVQVLPPTEVKVPVMQPCPSLDLAPPEPKYEPITGDYVHREAAILKNRELRKIESADLRAIINSCKGE